MDSSSHIPCFPLAAVDELRLLGWEGYLGEQVKGQKGPTLLATPADAMAGSNGSGSVAEAAGTGPSWSEQRIDLGTVGRDGAAVKVSLSIA